jgi:hypothetical protein
MANRAKVSDVDYIPFLLAAQTAFSCVEAKTDGAQEPQGLVEKTTGILKDAHSACHPSLYQVWKTSECKQDTVGMRAKSV